MADYYVEVKNKAALITLLTAEGFDASGFNTAQTVVLEREPFIMLCDWVGQHPTDRIAYPDEYVLIRALTPETDAYLSQTKFKKRVFPADKLPRVFL